MSILCGMCVWNTYPLIDLVVYMPSRVWCRECVKTHRALWNTSLFIKMICSTNVFRFLSVLFTVNDRDGPMAWWKNQQKPPTAAFGTFPCLWAALLGKRVHHCRLMLICILRLLVSCTLNLLMSDEDSVGQSVLNHMANCKCKDTVDWPCISRVLNSGYVFMSWTECHWSLKSWTVVSIMRVK